MEKVFSGIHNAERKKNNAVSTISAVAAYSLSRALTRLTHQASLRASQGALVVESPLVQVDSGSIPGSGDPLEEGTAARSSGLARRIPRTEEPGGPQSTGCQRHDRSDQHTYPDVSPGSRSLNRWRDCSFYVPEKNGTFHS